MKYQLPGYLRGTTFPIQACVSVDGSLCQKFCDLISKKYPQQLYTRLDLLQT